MPDILLREMDRQLQVREDCSLDLHLTYPCFPRNSALSTHYRREAEGYLAYISRLCRDVLPGLPPEYWGSICGLNASVPWDGRGRI